MYVTASVQEQENNLSTIKSNRTMSNEIFVAFATQKGGIGKSTITALAANYLHNVKGYNVAVIDCDAPQHSIYGLRDRETKLIDESRYFKALACEHFRKLKRNAYPVIASDAVNALDDAEKLISGEAVKPDIVFFDLPGTVNSAGILRTIAQMDYIFAPVSADKAVLESTLSFLDVLQRMMLGKETSRLKGLYLFWNQVDKRETSGLYEKYGQVVADMGLPMLQTRIPDTKRFRKEADGTGRTVFRSTLLAPDRRMLAGSGIPELTREIATILKLEGYEETAE